MVLFYGRKSLVVTEEMLKVLVRFQHQAAQQIMGMPAKRGTGGEWEYPSVVEATESVGLHHIGVYIRRRQETIAERVV